MSDSIDKGKLNGSVNVLAEAMRNVFSEAVISAVEPLREDMQAMENRLNGRIDDLETRIDNVKNDLETRIDNVKNDLETRIDTTNQNMQAQFAHQEKKIGTMIAGR